MNWAREDAYRAGALFLIARRALLHLAIVGVVLPVLAIAQGPVTPIFPLLPKPLTLPSGLTERLPLNTDESFFGEAIRAVDCPDPADARFGTCPNELFGGFVMGDSRLTGEIEIHFSVPVNNLAHFEVIHGVLPGLDGELQAPQGFEMPLRNASVSDAPGLISEGDLDLGTGYAINLRYSVIYADSGITALSRANPAIPPLIIQFPGPRGIAWARFEQRADGLLDYTFRGTTFLPLGSEWSGQPVRFPMPFCNRNIDCATVLARGTAFHPHLYLTTKQDTDPGCGLTCPNIVPNSTMMFTVNTYSSSFGDDFNLEIPELGGPGSGRSHLQGRLQIQFGPRTGDIVPFVVRSLVPEGLVAKPPQSSLLGPGFQPGLIGQDENLAFPSATYRLKRVVFVDEPFNIAHAALSLRTGKVIGEMVYPLFIGQSLAEVLFAENAGRISTDPFYLAALMSPASTSTYVRFEQGPNGETVFRFSGEHKRTFESFIFPTPDLIVGHGWPGGPGATLDIFARLQGIHVAQPLVTVRSGSVSDVVSSLGDRFSYSYSIPCEPAGRDFAFEYTNGNPGASGGTFHMTRLAAVQCLNSRHSALPAGDADIVTFSGFGTWSKDASGAAPRFATVQISTAPDSPYVGILVYQNPDLEGTVVLSSANTKPAEKPLP